eukprot:SAG11_NODE_2453_length_3345_cov_2.597659_2_plen_103_part_00
MAEFGAEQIEELYDCGNDSENGNHGRCRDKLLADCGGRNPCGAHVDEPSNCLAQKNPTWIRTLSSSEESGLWYFRCAALLPLSSPLVFPLSLPPDKIILLLY